ncbi:MULTISPECIES: histidine phosphatase family protein [unclassified Pseudomonas]|nr:MULTISPECIES: histidine phosphatase family protein [unclassified Pseudomonas]MEB0045201.1 histidine phosphatase family protein [Pseudomonas sp. Dout3]MEB0096443.1 histidine phosphatase family protein [Pseudomonas sp. DC1.2]WPX61397.1 histidine phosphatase family protein [Pseudomonas sp. DC1.2]
MISKRSKTSRSIKIVLAACVLLAVVLVTTYFLFTRSPANLGNAGSQASAELLRQWKAGEVAALVRHAERCDRSSNPCLGPADGITRIGSEAAATVGQGFMQLGMSQTDVFTSPMTRTQQTARAMFDKDAATQEWLTGECSQNLRDDVIAHKVPHRNLVLVTHSGCISHFEAQSGFKHAAATEYTSSLFVSIGNDGKLKVLGVLNAADWHSLLTQSATK